MRKVMGILQSSRSPQLSLSAAKKTLCEQNQLPQDNGDVAKVAKNIEELLGEIVEFEKIIKEIKFIFRISFIRDFQAKNIKGIIGLCSQKAACIQKCIDQCTLSDEARQKLNMVILKIGVIYATVGKILDILSESVATRSDKSSTNWMRS